MSAYYNEHDAYAAQWLRNLIAAGHIASGEVDERSIEDIRPDDLRGFRQCHFFAGIGVWSHALRSVGWPDDRRIWTGSCPCQPFSTAGKGGGLLDERHLWPAFFHLITHLRPERVVGEQVASPDGIAWLDLVQADLEAAHYTPRAVPFPAAGVGAPEIRDRLYWVADSDGDYGAGRLRTSHGRTSIKFDRRGALDGLAYDQSSRWREECSIGFRVGSRSDAQRVAPGFDSGGAPSRLVDSDQPEPSTGRKQRGGELGWAGGDTQGGPPDADGPGPVNGFWRHADWLICRDPRGPKWRPVEPGTFPLAHGATARVGRLRAYGNSLVAPQAIAFLRALD